MKIIPTLKKNEKEEYIRICLKIWDVFQSIQYGLEILNCIKMSVEENNEKTVKISNERYQELLEAEKMLICLQGAGVDNWGGYDDAMEMMAEMEDEE